MTKAEVETEAITWAIRLRDADAATWERFTAWLEAHPANAATYDHVATAGDGWIGSLDVPMVGLRRSRWRGLPWFAAAASLVAMAGLGWFALRPDQGYSVATAIGRQRAVLLADGTRVALAGGTRVTLFHGDPRRARLETGTALFRVVHQAGRPFEVRVGEETVRDVGTSFTITRTPAVVEVAVVEGAVLYEPDRAALHLGPGDRIVDADGPGAILHSKVAPQLIGNWRTGRLMFRNASLGDVADELGRATGLRVTIDPRLGGRRFTGTIVLDSGINQLAARLSALLGVLVQSTGDDWRFLPDDRALR